VNLLPVVDAYFGASPDRCARRPRCDYAASASVEQSQQQGTLRVRWTGVGAAVTVEALPIDVAPTAMSSAIMQVAGRIMMDSYLRVAATAFGHDVADGAAGSYGPWVGELPQENTRTCEL
jgi:hypothetical protein